MIQTLFKSLRGTDWELLSGFVSPAFFEVVPTLGMARVFATIVKDYANPAEFPAMVKVARKLIPAPGSRKGFTPEDRGHVVLALYFGQIFAKGEAVLDLRSSAFHFKSGKVDWDPKPLYYRWDPDFIDAVRRMYRGFYRDDESAFMSGLRDLDLIHAKDIFREHFGAGSQQSVTFELEHFKRSFQAIFESCKKNKTRLHPDFFALGAYLLCLYEHLEGLKVPLNVREAFDAVVK